MKAKDIQHLFWRAGFGENPKTFQRNTYKNRSQVVNDLFLRSNSYHELQIDTTDLNHFKDISLLQNKAKRMEFRKLTIEKFKEYNMLWVNRLMNSDQVLRERMTLFWANHFVCRDTNIFHVPQYNNTLRMHALGHFGDFVKAISKEASMLKYLNNKQNRKQKPNENFARELMELFTLGEGHYTEEDIKESARAFTGYNHNIGGEFVFRRIHHDYGFKSFLGHTGRYDGDDIIDIILEQKQCARFICKKIYSYFVNDIIDEDKVEELTTVFYKDYNIENVMRHLFLSDWFYDKKHIGSKIKSPIEFLVGMVQTVPVNFNSPKDVLKIQKLLGQVLLDPPNVAGWKGGRSWIDSNTMMLRLKLPSIILANAKISIKEKGAFEDSFKRYYSSPKNNRFVNVDVDWKTFEVSYGNRSYEELKQHLIVPQISNGTESYLKTLSQNSKRDYVVQLMSLPEYQMC
ncbi:DUF1800 family protein [Psychroserpens sp. XS_ASV72]|uniref:DUF1800 domain-containing protein n=1 Tax=Psychroserpens sp. XS_ASV72 TaxID=3241293 RepID=UPI0035113635